MLNSITYDMESFLEQCVARYLAVAGPDVKPREARTPFLAATAIRGPYRDPVSGDNSCAWCGFVITDNLSTGNHEIGGSGGHPTTLHRRSNYLEVNSLRSLLVC